MFGWLSTQDAETFGNTLAEAYDAKCRSLSGMTDRKQMARQEKAIVEIVLQAKSYRQEKKPNVLQKAALGNVFKWKLKDLGYDDEHIDALTKEILLALN